MAVHLVSDSCLPTPDIIQESYDVYKECTIQLFGSKQEVVDEMEDNEDKSESEDEFVVVSSKCMLIPLLID